MRVVPLGALEERLVAVLPARSLVPATCRGGVLALAELVEALKMVICHSFTRRLARAKADHGRPHT